MLLVSHSWTAPPEKLADDPHTTGYAFVGPDIVNTDSLPRATGQDHQLSEKVLKYILNFSGPWHRQRAYTQRENASWFAAQFASTFALNCQRSRVGQKGTQTKQTDSNADSQAPDFQADGQTDRETGS